MTEYGFEECPQCGGEDGCHTESCSHPSIVERAIAAERERAIKEVVAFIRCDPCTRTKYEDGVCLEYGSCDGGCQQCDEEMVARSIERKFNV